MYLHVVGVDTVGAMVAVLCWYNGMLPCSVDFTQLRFVFVASSAVANK